MPKRLLIGSDEYVNPLSLSLQLYAGCLELYLVVCYLITLCFWMGIFFYRRYVRIGNGNQLVRDPKRRTRILASEKVRWSLHTARMRLAKKRKFCQFFTRFGKCNKGEGKCPFIHDSSKIAVCTKFLNGLCADLNCKLTHKVYHAMSSGRCYAVWINF